MAKAARVSRLLEMVTLLQSGGGWAAKALAERFGVSRTRIFNDVRALREAGVPVRRSASGYTIDPSFFLPSVQLTPQEVLALLFPPQLFHGSPSNESVHRSAQAKLLSCLPPTLRQSAEGLSRNISVRLPVSGASDAVLEQVREAAAARRRIAIHYSGRSSDEPRRLLVDPYGLAFRKHAWYTVAYSVPHNEVRTFRVSRIAAIETTPLHFTVPKDFSVDAHFEGAWYVFGGDPREVLLRFSPRVARLVRDRVPHPGQRIQTLGNGTILYRAKVKSLDEVAWWLAQYGGEAVVLQPPELRDKVIELAASTLRTYGIRVGPRPRAYADAEAPPEGRVADADAFPPPAGQS